MPASKKSKKNIEQDKEKEKEAKKAKKQEEFLTRSSGKSKKPNTGDPYAKTYNNTRRRNLSNPNPPHTLSDHNTRAKKDCLRRGDSTPAFHGFES